MTSRRARVKLFQRVELFGNAAQNGRYISSKAKYWPETDSAQVEWSKDEKHFGKRVKQYVKLLKGKRLQPDLHAVDHPGFSPGHSAAFRPASFLVVG